MSLDGQVPGPRSLDGQGDGERLQGRWELPSGQDGGGGASHQRVVGHFWLGDYGIAACV